MPHTRHFSTFIIKIVSSKRVYARRTFQQGGNMDRGVEVKWQESLSIGYATIDGHHKKLVRIVEELRNMLDLPEVEYRLKIGKMLKQLSDYTIYHFNEEERIMQKYEYPNLREHATIHAFFVEKLHSTLPLIAKGDKSVAIEMYGFLSDWLIEHIAVEDRKWAEFIHKTYPDEDF